jgi:ferredoxin/flavodoxin---NADP+ reductase
MLNNTSRLLEARGFHIAPRSGASGDYVVERAFVTR